MARPMPDQIAAASRKRQARAAAAAAGGAQIDFVGVVGAASGLARREAVANGSEC